MDIHQGTGVNPERLQGANQRVRAGQPRFCIILVLHGDGVIWVYGVGEDGVMAFTDFGIENLVDLIKMRKDRTLLNHRDGDK
jgi:hypothetical protein